MGYFFRPDRLVVSFTLSSAGGNTSQVELFSRPGRLRPGRLRPGSVRLSWQGEGVPQGVAGVSSTLAPGEPATGGAVQSLVSHKETIEGVVVADVGLVKGGSHLIWTLLGVLHPPKFLKCSVNLQCMALGS